MDRNTSLRTGLALMIFVFGSVQAWDSDVPKAGLLIVFLVSLAVALPPVALLTPLTQTYFIGVMVVSFILMLLARLLSPIPLPGHFIALVPAVMRMIFTGMIRKDT